MNNVFQFENYEQMISMSFVEINLKLLFKLEFANFSTK